MRERYCEEKNKTIFKCEQCESEFAYKKTLMFHIKSKHEGNYSVYECDICHSKYSNKQNLAKHVKLKHWSYEPGFQIVELMIDIIA